MDNRTADTFGYASVLGHVPALLSACVEIDRRLAANAFSPRSRALVAMAVAGRMGDDYCTWVHSRLASHAGLSAEAIFLAASGTALEAREREMVLLAVRVTEARRPASGRARLARPRSLLPEAEEAEVIAQAVGNITINELLREAAPASSRATPRAH